MACTEEDLIERVRAIKVAAADSLTAAQVQSMLTADGIDVELGQVKKAASKATKRMKNAVPVPTPPADVGKLVSKQEAKRTAQAAEALRSAELAMMTAQRTLHSERWMVALHGSSAQTKAFIDRAGSQAISGSIDDGDSVSKERVEADVATLQYILTAGSPFDLPAEKVAAAKAQLDKLEKFRSMPTGRLDRPFVSNPTFQGFRPNFVFKTGPLGLGYYHEQWFSAAWKCYEARATPSAAPDESEEDTSSDSLDPALRDILNERHTRGGVNSTASLDKAMAKASMLATPATGSAMDDMD